MSDEELQALADLLWRIRHGDDADIADEDLATYRRLLKLLESDNIG